MRFKVVLSGRGISLPFEGSPDPAVGFFTTRWVTARDTAEAASVAIERVISEWRPAGVYDAGGIPDVAGETVNALGWWAGLFARKPGAGYTFYRHED
jgi:hypothetical protein